MLFIRSLLFKISFVIMTIIEMALFSPFYFFLPHKPAWFVPRTWAKSCFWLQKIFAGVHYRFEGLENLPEGAYIVAPKHQSTWETMALPLCLPDPTMVLKRDLLRIPLWGWYLGKMGMVPINRGEPLKALKILIEESRKKAEQGRQIVIFPEGARHEPGSAPDYKPGVYPIYSELNLPVVPIALNAGLYWSPKRFLVYPGTIICRILPPIEPGLKRKEFMRRLETAIESECDALLEEAANSENPPYLPPAAKARLKQIEAAKTGEKAGKTA